MASLVTPDALPDTLAEIPAFPPDALVMSDTSIYQATYEGAPVTFPPEPDRPGVCAKCRRHIGRGARAHEKACRG